MVLNINDNGINGLISKLIIGYSSDIKLSKDEIKKGEIDLLKTSLGKQLILDFKNK